MKPHVSVLFPAVLLALALMPPVPLPAADFIRGDVNGDGKVTVSDAWLIILWVQDGYGPPQCMDAADADDDGVVEADDSVYLFESLFCCLYVSGKVGAPIPPPFPRPGPDPTDDALDCGTYGGGEALVDPDSELKFMDPFPCELPPGTPCMYGHDHPVVLVLALKTPRNIAAVSGRIRFLDPILQCYEAYNFHREAGYYNMNSGGEFGATFEDPQPWDGRVMNFFFCLKPGTPPGEYPFVLEWAELTDGDTGQVIIPVTSGGTFVLEEATLEPDLESNPWCLACQDPSPIRPESVNAVFEVGLEAAAPGGTVTVPFTLRSNAPVDGYSFSLDFDEDVLQVESAEFVWEKPDGEDYDFSLMEFNNRNDNPGNAGIDEGFVVGATVFDIFRQEPPNKMPAYTDNLAVRIHFQVDPGVSATTTQIRFLDGARIYEGTGEPVSNIITTFSFSVSPEIANSFLLLDGRITVIPDIATFRRGDSNGDSKVDLSDATTTLGFLFLGSPAPVCFDAADFNDDGGIDVTDPIGTLTFLFLDGKTPPPPFSQAGSDPTRDSIGCLFRE